MSITFHCESCKKKVKVPDDTGGKWANCPHCNHRCYIPRPPSEDDEELKLAPIDETKEKEYGRKMHETYALTRNILRETEELEGASGVAHSSAEINEKELLKHIIIYLKYMADGQLRQAEKTTAQLTAHKKAVRDILKRMAKAERPEPELADIAPRLLKGVMKDLYTKLD